MRGQKISVTCRVSSDHVPLLLLLYALNHLNRLDIMKSAFVLLGIALAALKATGIPQSPPVKVSLRSSWPSPPMLAEIL